MSGLHGDQGAARFHPVRYRMLRLRPAHCLLQILTPLQKARMVGMNYPHFPDVLQIMRAIMRLPRDGSIR